MEGMRNHKGSSSIEDASLRPKGHSQSCALDPRLWVCHVLCVLQL